MVGCKGWRWASSACPALLPAAGAGSASCSLFFVVVVVLRLFLLLLFLLLFRFGFLFLLLFLLLVLFLFLFSSPFLYLFLFSPLFLLVGWAGLGLLQRAVRGGRVSEAAAPLPPPTPLFFVPPRARPPFPALRGPAARRVGW